MTTANDPAQNSFAYTAQTLEGTPMTGTIDASSLDVASKQLSKLGLRIMRLDPAPRPPRAKPLAGEDFAAFNQQLAHLSAAGLPVEQGLRLIAEDLHHGGLAQSVRNVSEELEKGVPLAEAFGRHRKQFPPLYGALIQAGVRAGNLPAALLNLGRHLELVARLRAAVWRAAAYPMAVVGGLLAVLIFLGTLVLPKYEVLFNGFHTQLPPITRLVMAMSRLSPLFIALAILIVIGLPLLQIILRQRNIEPALTDLALPIPLIGPPLRRNLIARWCDALKLTVEAGMDLPAGVRLACDIVGSPKLSRDGEMLIAELAGGRGIDHPDLRPRILPKPVLAVLQLAADRSDLPSALATLSAMYEQQAEMRLAAVQSILAPALLLAVAILIGTTVVGLFAPLAALLRMF